MNGEIVCIVVGIVVTIGLIVFALLLDNRKSEKTVTVELDGPEHTDEEEIVVIEGCEYIRSIVHGGCTYCHKGNCKNSIHIYNKEKNESI